MNIHLLFSGALLPVAMLLPANPLPQDGLQSHWRADDLSNLVRTGGREPIDDAKKITNSVTYATAWTASGACPITLRNHEEPHSWAHPYWYTNGFQRADGTWAPTLRFNWRPFADRWDASRKFQSLQQAADETTDFNITDSATWFFVARFHITLTGESDCVCPWGLTGPATNYVSSRFGIFEPKGSGNFRLHAINHPGNSGVTAVPEAKQPILLDARNGETGFSAGKNADAAFPPLISPKTPMHAGRFWLNGGLAEMTSPGTSQDIYRANMDVAELVIYNRALNDAEMLIARTSLAVKYGLGRYGFGADATATSPFLYDGDETWLYDLIGLGTTTDTGTGRVPGTAALSGWSAELQLERLSGLTENGSYLFAAHDAEADNAFTEEAALGVTRWTRTWRLERYAENPVTVRFRFALPAGSTGFQGILLMKAPNADAFSALSVPGVVSDGTITFDVADTDIIHKAEYTLAKIAGAPAGSLTLWLRADTAVYTDESGVVTNWANQGSLGNVLDALSATGQVYTAANVANGQPVIRFPGEAFLLSRSTSNYGITADEGRAWFAVYSLNNPKWNSKWNGGQMGHGLFGSETGNRFGAFFQADKTSMQCYAGDQNNSLLLGNVQTNTWYLTDLHYYLSGCPSVATNGLVAVVQSTSTGESLQVPASSRVKIGHFLGEDWLQWNPPFMGDIAEIRVYNRTLDAMERLVTQHALLARYGIAPAETPSPFASTDPALQIYHHAVAGVGARDEGAGAVRRYACSDGLLLALPSIPENGSLVLAAHDGGEGWSEENLGGGVTSRLAREWRLVKTGAAQTVRLTFAVPSVSADVLLQNEWCLLSRTAPNAAFTAHAAPSAVTATAVSFDLPADQTVTGLYTIGLKDKGLSTTKIIIR